MHGLRFGARIQQRAHAERALRIAAAPSGRMPTYTASAATCRNRLAATASVERRAESSAQWISTRCGDDCLRRQHHHFGRAVPQQPLDLLRGFRHARRSRRRRRSRGCALRLRRSPARARCAWRCASSCAPRARSGMDAARALGGRGLRAHSRIARQRCRQNVNAPHADRDRLAEHHGKARCSC